MNDKCRGYKCSYYIKAFNKKENVIHEVCLLSENKNSETWECPFQKWERICKRLTEGMARICKSAEQAANNIVEAWIRCLGQKDESK